MFTSRGNAPAQSGYIVIVVLLLAAILLMLGLSMAARTTEEVFLSSQEADTTRVFNAAESGVEEALYQLNTGTKVEDLESVVQQALGELNEADISVTASEAETIEQITVKEGQSLTLKYTAEDPVLTWNVTDCPTAPSLLVTFYTAEKKAYHQTYSAKSAGTKCQNTLTNEATVNGTKNSVTTKPADFGITLEPEVTGPSAGLFYRVTPLYNDATFLDVTNSGAVVITSTATDQQSSESPEVRRVRVTRTEPAPPSIFDYAVYSGGSLEKN